MNGKALWSAKREKTIQEPKPASHRQAVRRTIMTVGATIGVFLMIGTLAVPLCAQSYPNKPIRLIIPMTGGTVDFMARLTGPKLAERLGQPVVHENRPGAGGNIGCEIAARSKPDGYTILQTGPSFTISPSIYNKLNYDPLKDFAPISQNGQIPMVVVVRPSLPFKNFKELIDYAKANPKKLNYGSAGIGSSPHLTPELIKNVTKIDIVHVPYKGGSQVMVGLLSGEVDMYAGPISTCLQYIVDGKLRAIVVLSKERVSSLPDVPTAKESGIDNLEVINWYGIMAPAGTPRNIINRLNSEWTKIAAMPDTIEIMKKASMEAVSNKPEEFSEFLKDEVARWGRVIKEANIPRID
jgi:tripartite-type tricarboxylate transporter receptor subunit TctC